MGVLTIAMTTKPTFQEVAALVCTLALMAIIGFQSATGHPVDPDMKVALAGALAYTFGVRSGRTDQIVQEHKESKAETQDGNKDKPLT